MNKLPIRIIAIFTALFICFISFAKTKTVDYHHKPFSPTHGCIMHYSVEKQDSSFYIIATVVADQLSFLAEPQMKIKTFNNDTITLKGVNIGRGQGYVGTVAPGLMLYEASSIAQFPVTPQQFELIKDGVAKIRISMTPTDHKKTFKKDKIGKKIYNLFLEQQATEEEAF